MFFWNGKSTSLPPKAMNDRFSTTRMRWPGIRSRSHFSISGCLKWKKCPE